MFLSLCSLSASLLSSCRCATTASNRKTQTASFLLTHLPQPLLCLGIFPLLSTCKSSEIFYLSFLLETKRHQYGWIGDYLASLLVPSLRPPSQLVSSFGLPPFLSLFVYSVSVQNSRSGYFTIFCRLQSCGWILCPGATRELKLIQEFLSYTCRGWRVGFVTHRWTGNGLDQGKGVGHRDTMSILGKYLIILIDQPQRVSSTKDLPVEWLDPGAPRTSTKIKKLPMSIEERERERVREETKQWGKAKENK